MAYDLYVLNQRLPRFPLLGGYADPSALADAVEKAFASWITESLVGNLQRRKACSQVFDFAVHMESADLTLEKVRAHDFDAYLQAQNPPRPPLSRFGDFLIYARKRLPELKWQ